MPLLSSRLEFRLSNSQVQVSLKFTIFFGRQMHIMWISELLGFPNKKLYFMPNKHLLQQHGWKMFNLSHRRPSLEWNKLYRLSCGNSFWYSNKTMSLLPIGFHFRCKYLEMCLPSQHTLYPKRKMYSLWISEHLEFSDEQMYIKHLPRKSILGCQY